MIRIVLVLSLECLYLIWIVNDFSSGFWLICSVLCRLEFGDLDTNAGPPSYRYFKTIRGQACYRETASVGPSLQAPNSNRQHPTVSSFHTHNQQQQQQQTTTAAYHGISITSNSTRDHPKNVHSTNVGGTLLDGSSSGTSLPRVWSTGCRRPRGLDQMV